MKNCLRITLIMLLGVVMGGCAPNFSPNVYSARSVGQASSVVSGTIVSIRNIRIRGTTGVGALTGVAAGAVAGSNIGGTSSLHTLGAIGGAVLGGALGHHVEKGLGSQRGVELIVRTKGNQRISVVQAGGIKFHVGQRVNVIYGHNRTRIVPK
jgi:outer membrane lipoprotein SlyB